MVAQTQAWPSANLSFRRFRARTDINNHGQLIWAIADLLRGDYKQSEYGRVILPFVVLRRLDCVLEPSKQQVRARLASLEGRVAAGNE